MDESTAELAASAWFESLRVRVLSAADVEDDHGFGPGKVALGTVFSAALKSLNPSIPDTSLDSVGRFALRPPHPTLVQNNRWFHRLLTDGVEVEYRDNKT